MDADDKPDFAALQASIEAGPTGPLVYFAFDLLMQGKRDLRPLPLLARKEALATLLDPAPAGVRYLAHFAAAGEAVLRAACQLGLEGVVSKKTDAPYTPAAVPPGSKQSAAAATSSSSAAGATANAVA